MAGGAKYSTSLLIFQPTCSVDFWDTLWKYTEQFMFPTSLLLSCCESHIFRLCHLVSLVIWHYNLYSDVFFAEPLESSLDTERDNFVSLYHFESGKWSFNKDNDISSIFHNPLTLID